jgi:hypothetical protein
VQSSLALPCIPSMSYGPQIAWRLLLNNLISGYFIDSAIGIAASLKWIVFLDQLERQSACLLIFFLRDSLLACLSRLIEAKFQSSTNI